MKINFEQRVCKRHAPKLFCDMWLVADGLDNAFLQCPMCPFDAACPLFFIWNAWEQLNWGDTCGTIFDDVWFEKFIVNPQYLQHPIGIDDLLMHVFDLLKEIAFAAHGPPKQKI